MGEQTTIALLAFVVCHVGVIFGIVAIAGNEWVETEPVKQGGQPVTNQTCHKGLWQLCCGEEGGEVECDKVNESQQPNAFKSVQGLYVSALGTLILGTGLYWVFLLGRPQIRTSLCLSSTIVGLEWVSAILAFCALLVFGLTYKNNDDIDEDILKERLGWSYFVAMTGGIMTFLAGLFGLRLIMLIKSRPVGYEDL